MVIADTGFWLALYDRDDRHHGLARRCLEALDEPLVTTWPVVTEAAYLLFTRLGPASGVALLRNLHGTCTFHDLAPDSPVRLADLMERYANLPMDLADASLVVLAEHLGHGRILTTDWRDFSAYRWDERKSFENLLLDA
jgi:predicted nucleic acid-binding protein